VSRHRITGKERDAESGNDYFGARYFASTMGRFLSPDWSAKAEPVSYAKLDDPQSLNLYSYVRNNPLSRIDADGHYELNNSGCADNAKCQKKWDKAANKFESRREKDLKSKNAGVRAAVTCPHFPHGNLT
jgi:RHS repeat-associated protein